MLGVARDAAAVPFVGSTIAAVGVRTYTRDADSGLVGVAGPARLSVVHFRPSMPRMSSTRWTQPPPPTIVWPDS